MVYCKAIRKVFEGMGDLEQVQKQALKAGFDFMLWNDNIFHYNAHSSTWCETSFTIKDLEC